MLHIDTLVVACLVALAAAGSTPRKLNPFERDLRVLLQEPPVGVDNQRTREPVEEFWLTQQRDHFNEADNETWRMRYLRNDRYFQRGGPMFIFVGGEWEISPGFLRTGHMYDVASQHGGILFYTEHRFYGKSWPTRNTSMAHLRYLDSRQALADLAHFIRDQKARHPSLAESKVILTGSSYAGSLVTWFTRFYPDLVDGVWASSAPGFAKLNFYDYMNVVGFSIKQEGGWQCYRRLQRGFEGLARILNSAEAAEVLKRLQICENFQPTNTMDIAAFFSGIGNYFASIVQSYSTRIGAMCSSLISLHKSDDVEALLQFFELIYWPQLERVQDWCLDFSFEGMQALLTNITDRSAGTRQWFYQTCSEFGWYPTTMTSQRHPFGRQVPLEYFQQLCLQVFGSTYTLTNMSQATRRTNRLYGYSQPGIEDDGFLDGDDDGDDDGDGDGDGNSDTNANATYANVLFTHGELDPWRALMLHSTPEGNAANVIVIPGYSHSDDLGSLNVNDSVALNVAKLKVAAFIRKSLREP